MTAKCKQSPVSLVEAQAIYDRTMNERRAKGYRPGPDAAPVEIQEPQKSQAVPVGARDGAGHISGLPGHMLLSECTEAERDHLLSQPEWFMQPKFDGVRVRIIHTQGQVKALSRTQKPVNLCSSAA